MNWLMSTTSNHGITTCIQFDHLRPKFFHAGGGVKSYVKMEH